MSALPSRPITILIAALGGEGGGVLADWLTSAAASLGFPVQSTSIPGVAQRTGATTYYVEILPVRSSELAGRRPVLSLTPGIGDIDILLASEPMEACRAVAQGFVTPDRTAVIASTHRSYVISEKIAMGDGRVDPTHLIGAIEQNAQAHWLIDLDDIARRNATMLNAVMLGALAGCGRLPIPTEAFETAIGEAGRAVESNLRGFRAGFARVRSSDGAPQASGPRRPAGSAKALPDIEQEIAATMPAFALDVMVEGIRRLARYQDISYARVYVERLATIRDDDQRAGAGGRLVRETARHLALRMSFEDVIRVAQAKIEPARLKRIAADIGAKPGDPYVVVEFLKPGIEEICSILPVRLARTILRQAERRGWLNRFHWAMEIKTTTVAGFLRLWLLAKLRPLRPKSYRFAQEQAAIENWLELVRSAAKLSGELALEVATCARLIKGYGDTNKRGNANFQMIETRVIRPVLVGRIPLRQGIDAVASAREAALLDPDGEGLAQCIAEIERQAPIDMAAE